MTIDPAATSRAASSSDRSTPGLVPARADSPGPRRIVSGPAVDFAVARRKRRHAYVIGPSDWLEDEERYRDQQRRSWLE
ncbi:hypothetical protein [Nocardia stercoris]|uniref:hypothetical protein n=1 Tax=Nocardia stercoris TaxID=2483361 RepID=UPI0011C3E073|nr:hypothetical protein [Nocardia stercoris]